MAPKRKGKRRRLKTTTPAKRSPEEDEVQDFISFDEIEEPETPKSPIEAKQIPTIKYPDFLPNIEILEKELRKYVDSTSLLKVEVEARERLVSQIEAIAKNIWPSIRVRKYGSFKTGLATVTSDVDIALVHGCEHDASECVGALSQEIAKAMRVLEDGEEEPLFGGILSITSARVPIVKGISLESGISFDVSFVEDDAPLVAVNTWVRRCVDERAIFRPLVIVLKSLLRSRNLNQPKTGGMGGYLLNILVLAFLRYRERNLPHPLVRRARAHRERYELAIAFVEFLEFYGSVFKGRHVSVCAQADPIFRRRAQKAVRDLARYKPENPLSVEDPNSDPPTDIGAGCFNFPTIAFMFEWCFAVLTMSRAAIAKLPAHGEGGILDRVLPRDPQEVIIRQRCRSIRLIELSEPSDSDEASSHTRGPEHPDGAELLDEVSDDTGWPGTNPPSPSSSRLGTLASPEF